MAKILALCQVANSYAWRHAVRCNLSKSASRDQYRWWSTNQRLLKDVRRAKSSRRMQSGTSVHVHIQLSLSWSPLSSCHFLLTSDKRAVDRIWRAAHLESPTATPKVPTLDPDADTSIASLTKRFINAVRITFVVDSCKVSNLKTAFKTRKVLLNRIQWQQNNCTIAVTTIVKFLVWIRRNISIPRPPWWICTPKRVKENGRHGRLTELIIHNEANASGTSANGTQGN